MVWVCCGFSAAGQQLVLKYGVGVLWFQCVRTATCFEVWCGCVVVSVWQADGPLSGGAGPVLCGLCQVGILAGREVSVCSEQSHTGMQWGGGGGDMGKLDAGFRNKLSALFLKTKELSSA